MNALQVQYVNTRKLDIHELDRVDDTEPRKNRLNKIIIIIIIIIMIMINIVFVSKFT